MLIEGPHRFLTGVLSSLVEVARLFASDNEPDFALRASRIIRSLALIFVGAMPRKSRRLADCGAG